MKKSLLSILSCPECSSSLSLRVFKENELFSVQEIEEGLLTCTKNQEHWYIIAKYIPRMLSDSIKEFPKFEEQYKQNLPKPKNNQFPEESFKKLQEKTKRSFGFEWQKWNRFGWDDSVPLKVTRDIFDYKVLATKHELQGKLVLDAGCGNGRYTKIAREYGGEVVGIDLSQAIDEAFENFKGDPKAHFVQGDLFKLPFKKETFDFIFSNGVLMHTGDAKKAFISIASRLNNKGIITVHLYHKGNIIYEFNDWWLREITTRLPFRVIYSFSKGLAQVAKILPKNFVLYGLNAFFRIEPHEHYVFDWYTAPIATHHTYREVYGWLKEANLHLVADHNTTKYPWRKYIFPFQFLTVKAQKEPVKESLIKHTIY